jgi:hypothetical protein
VGGGWIMEAEQLTVQQYDGKEGKKINTTTGVTQQ